MAFPILPKPNDCNHGHSYSSSLSADTELHNWDFHAWLSDAVAVDRYVGVSGKSAQRAACWLGAASHHA